MPRPGTKKQLLEAIEVEHQALEGLLDRLSSAQMVLPGVVGEWSVKDVLAHLLEWQQMVLSWHAAGVKGKIPVTPAEGFNWAQLPELNQRIYEKHCKRPLADIQKEFKSSHKKMLNIIQALSEEELFTRGHYAWTKNNTLGTYFVSCTSSHYNWARTNIKKGLKAGKLK
ncbi:MAG TPA: ClbS/DfsB family four-helix bundle protein [Anaerolineales bacterium]|nr:ClbS/DfsB family four-helix bundle protein [Anaerolineales bacterium]